MQHIAVNKNSAIMDLVFYVVMEIVNKQVMKYRMSMVFDVMRKNEAAEG